MSSRQRKLDADLAVSWTAKNQPGLTRGMTAREALESVIQNVFIALSANGR